MWCSLVRRNEKKTSLFFFLDEKEPKNQAQLQPFGEKFLIDQFSKRVSAEADKRQALFLSFLFPQKKRNKRKLCAVYSSMRFTLGNATISLISFASS
jgi:hypothetical protein